MVRTHLPRLIVIQICVSCVDQLDGTISCWDEDDMKMTSWWLQYHRRGKDLLDSLDQNLNLKKKTARKVETILCSGKYAQQTRFQTLTRISILMFLSLQITNRVFCCLQQGPKVALYLIKKTRGWKHSIGVLQNSPSSAGLRTST